MDDVAIRGIMRSIEKLPDDGARFTVMTNKAIHEFRRKLSEGEIADLDAREGVWRVWNRALTREEIRALLAEARGEA